MSAYQWRALPISWQTLIQGPASLQLERDGLALFKGWLALRCIHSTEGNDKGASDHGVLQRHAKG